MNQISYEQTIQTPCIPDQRSSRRHQAEQLLAISPKGTGQIIDISTSGLSFGCLYPHYFQDEWLMDILDARGSHIKQLKVRKIWEIHEAHPDPSNKYDTVVGVEFIDLSKKQSHELDYIITSATMQTTRTLHV